MKILKRILNLFTITISAALCVAIFGLQMAIHTIHCTKDYLSIDGIKKIVTNMDLDDFLNDLNDENGEFIDEIYLAFEENGFDSGVAKEIMNSKDIKVLIGNYVSSSLQAVIDGTEVEKPTSDEVMDIIENKTNLLEEIAKEEGVELTSERKEEYLKDLRESVDELLESLPDLNKEFNGEETSLADILKIINHVFSTQLILAIIFAIGILYLLISLLRWSFHKAMLWLSIPTILASLTVISFASNIRNIRNLVTMDAQVYSFLDKTIFTELSNKLFMSGFINLLIGIALIAGFIWIKKRKENSQKEIITT